MELKIIDNTTEDQMEAVEMRSFTNEKGLKITGFCPIDIDTGESTLEGAVFQGTVLVQSNMGPMPLDFEFPPTYTLKQCMEEFEQVAEFEVKAKIEEQRDRDRIMTPADLQAQPGGQILTP